MILALSFAVAAILALILTPLATRLAWATGYLDHPEARKLHTSATALLGGVAVLVATIGGWAASRSGQTTAAEPRSLYLIGGALVAVLLGLWDDRFGMQPPAKLLGQATAGGIFLASGVQLGVGLPPAIELAIALLAMVTLMNAVNFLDNMNGMVPGVGAIILAAFAWDSATRGAMGVAAAQLAMAGACIGFLRYNFPRASIFLGDAGSLVLGYSLGASAILAVAGSPPGWGRLGPVLMLGYPAFDMIFVVVNRVREGRRIYEGGKDHTNHRLASVMQCPKRTVLLLWFSTAALCASGLVVLRQNRPMPALLLSALWSVLLILSGLRLSSIATAPRPSRHPDTPRPSPMPPTSGSAT